MAFTFQRSELQDFVRSLLQQRNGAKGVDPNVSYSYLVATKAGYGWDPFDIVRSNDFPLDNVPRLVKYLRAEISMHDEFGHTFSQGIEYGRWSGCLVDASAANETGGLENNVDSSLGDMVLAISTPTHIRIEGDFGTPGVPRFVFECILSKEYTYVEEEADIWELYQQRTLDDVPKGGSLNLFWQGFFEHNQGPGAPGLPLGNYIDKRFSISGSQYLGFEFDYYAADPRPPQFDHKTLVEVVNPTGAASFELPAHSEDNFLGRDGRILFGVLIRNQPGSHCYEEETQVAARGLTYHGCQKILADTKKVVRLQPPRPLHGVVFDTDFNVQVDRWFHPNSLPNGNLAGCHCVPPPAPPVLVATSGVGKVVLTWTVPPTDLDETFEIFRSTKSGKEVSIANIHTLLTYTDFNVTAGTEYFYKVKALNSVGRSAFSNEAHATPT